MQYYWAPNVSGLFLCLGSSPPKQQSLHPIAETQYSWYLLFYRPLQLEHKCVPWVHLYDIPSQNHMLGYKKQKTDTESIWVKLEISHSLCIWVASREDWLFDMTTHLSWQSRCWAYSFNLLKILKVVFYHVTLSLKFLS